MIEHAAEDASPDDVRALENVGFVLDALRHADRARVRNLLLDQVSSFRGWE